MNEPAKINEAKYFYDQMVKNLGNPQDFKHNVSAFLSSARSVLQYVYKEIQGNNNLAWYEACMSSDDILAFFKAKRDIEVHHKPIILNANTQVHDVGYFTESAMITKYDTEGNLIEEVSLPSEPPQVNDTSKAQYRYLFEGWTHSTDDVLMLSQKYIQAIESMVKDGVAKGFLTP